MLFRSSPLFLFSPYLSSAFSLAGRRSQPYARGCYDSHSSTVNHNKRILLSGYFDLTLMQPGLLGYTPMAFPGLWLPVRQTLCRTIHLACMLHIFLCSHTNSSGGLSRVSRRRARTGFTPVSPNRSFLS